MKNGFDIVTDVRSLINIDEITSQITGGVYALVRPDNSEKTDIVIGLLNADNEFIQVADVNIRIHAPNERADGSTQSYPPFNTLKTLTALVLPFVEAQYRYSFYTYVDIPGDIIQDRDGSWFSLIRITYRSVQDNFKNY